MVKFSSQTIVGAIAGIGLGASVATLSGARAGERFATKTVNVYLSQSERDAVAAVIQANLNASETPERIGCVLDSPDESQTGNLYACVVSVEKKVASIDDIGEGGVFIRPIAKPGPGPGEVVP